MYTSPGSGLISFLQSVGRSISRLVVRWPGRQITEVWRKLGASDLICSGGDTVGLLNSSFTSSRGVLEEHVEKEDSEDMKEEEQVVEVGVANFFRQAAFSFSIFFCNFCCFSSSFICFLISFSFFFFASSCSSSGTSLLWLSSLPGLLKNN